MRDTKDIADAVFRIRDEYLEQKKKKHIRIEKICAAVSAAAAAVVITAGALHYYSSGTIPVHNNDNRVIVTGTVPPTQPTTTVCVTSAHAASEHISTAATVTASSVKETNTASMISSKVTNTASSAETTVSAVNNAVQNGTAADMTATRPIVTTDIDDAYCEEVITMKALKIRKYIAALSAAALVGNGAQLPVYATSLYTPKQLSPKTDIILYIEDNNDRMDFDGNGKFDAFDAYALFTYVNEASSLPDGYAARCAANGDINGDGAVDVDDSDILKEYCVYRFTQYNFTYFYNNGKYLVPSDADLHTHVERSLSPDTPEDLREKLSSELVDSCYTYGSEENKNSFIDYCFNGVDSFRDYDQFNEVFFKRFSAEVEKGTYDLDVNEDGVVDLKDLYDIYIYDVASADDGSIITKDYYFAQFINEEIVVNGEIIKVGEPSPPLRELLPMPEEYKQHLWAKCEPMYESINTLLYGEENSDSLCSSTVFENIARYIMNNTEFDLMNTSDLYYAGYHGVLTLCDHSVSESFVRELKVLLYRHFDEVNEMPSLDDEDIPGKLFTLIKDYDYMNDNDAMMDINRKAKEDFDKGLTRELYDVNKDGKVDYLDSYTFDIYISDLWNGVNVENSILPAEWWNYLDKQVDLDNDGIAGSYIDFLIVQYVAGRHYQEPQYKRDIYYLELVEKKGLADLSDIRPYIEKLCKGKAKGDVDLDGKVTAVDASAVLGYYAQNSVNSDVSLVTEAKMQYMADCNSDGYVNSVDASEILAVYAQNSVQN